MLLLDNCCMKQDDVLDIMRLLVINNASSFSLLLLYVN